MIKFIEFILVKPVLKKQSKVVKHNIELEHNVKNAIKIPHSPSCGKHE